MPRVSLTMPSLWNQRSIRVTTSRAVPKWAAIFVFARYHLTALPGWAAWLADRSFGVYLIHVLVLELLAEAGWDVLAFAPAWWTPVLALAVFAVSALAAAILQKVPLLGKYLA